MFQQLNLPPQQAGAIWSYHPDYAHTPRHHHRELEFNIITSGQARYLLDDCSYELTANTCAWLFPEQEHVLVDTSSDFHMWIVVWTPELVQEMCAGPRGLATTLRAGNPPGTWYRKLSRGSQRELSLLCDRVYHHQDQGVQTDAGLSWLLTQAWTLFNEANSLRSGDAAHPAVRKALYVLGGPNPPSDLPQLARTCGLSPDRLGRLFHEATGTTISHYRNRLRCETACSLMQDTSHDLTHVALRAGFNSYTQFHRVFAKEFGLSPGKWRREMV